MDADRLSLESKADLRLFLAEELGLQYLLGALVSRINCFLQTYTQPSLHGRMSSLRQTIVISWITNYTQMPWRMYSIRLFFARHATALYRMGEFAERIAVYENSLN